MAETGFLDLFGVNPRARVLDFFVENDTLDYSKDQVAEITGVSWISLDKFWDNLIKMGIIKKTRKIGKSELFKLNELDPIAKYLIKIDKELTLRDLDRE